MAAKDIPINPKLRQFVLRDVLQTGTKIGAGAYGSVEEVVVAGAICAAKTIHNFFRDDAQVPAADIKKTTVRFVRECQLMSSLRHPNIVQFLGVAFFPGSQLPALIMERLLTNLHDLLAPETQPPPTFFPYNLKCSILHNVACGLAHLHGQSPPVIHRDLSARNVLLSSAMVAKIADLGVARIVPRVGAAATMTKAPGAGVYIPPEALENKPGDENEDVNEQEKKSKYDMSIDIFSFGVVAIFTLSKTFPCDLLAPTYRDSGDRFLARTELQRRERYMKIIFKDLRRTHPLVRMIEGCLNFPEKRPSISEVLHLLEEAQTAARYEAGDEQMSMNRLELVQALTTSQSSVHSKERELEDAQVELRQKDELLQSSEKEGQRVTKQLSKRRTELTKAEQTISKKEQQIQEMRQHEAKLVQTKDHELAEAQQSIKQLKQQEIESLQAKDRELAQAQQQIEEFKHRETELTQKMEKKLAETEQQLEEKEEKLKSNEAMVADILLQLTKYAKTSGQGLTSATVNHPTHVLVELIDAFGKPCSVQLNVAAEMELEKATPDSQQKISLPVVTTSPAQYEVSYTVANRGPYKLHILVNEMEINGSPFPVTVYPDPTTLSLPDRIVPDLNKACGIAINTQGEMIVSEFHSHKLSIHNTTTLKIRRCQSGDNQFKIDHPRGIAIDDAENIYVTSKNMLQKFSSSGELIAHVGQKGKNKDFNDPHGVTIYKDEVYVCDSDNHRIQVFDLDLKPTKSIGSRGTKEGKFNAPRDVKFDSSGNMYVAEFKNKRVQVMSIDGEFIRQFVHELCGPAGLHIADKYVYVSDYHGHCIVVYETSGQFVTSFGKQGHKNGEFNHPMCITSCADGFIYVCDCHNDRVQVF